MQTVTYTFDTATDYTYDDTKIQVLLGSASLVSPYATSNPVLKNAVALTVSSISEIAATCVVTGEDALKYVVEKDGVDKWWNTATSAWETSSGYAQSNTLAEINAHLSTLGTTYFSVRLGVYFHSASGSTTPVLDSLTFTLDFHGVRPATPGTTLVWGYLYDVSGNPVEDVRVSVRLPDDTFKHTSSKTKLSMATMVTHTASDGYWELPLVPNSTMTPTTGSSYLFSFSGLGFDIRDEIRTVTVASTINYTDLQ